MAQKPDHLLVDLALTYFPPTGRAECTFCNTVSDWLDDSAAGKVREVWSQEQQRSAGTRVCALCFVTSGAPSEFTGVRRANREQRLQAPCTAER